MLGPTCLRVSCLAGAGKQRWQTEVNFSSVLGKREGVEQRKVGCHTLLLPLEKESQTPLAGGGKGGAIYAVLP